MTPYGICVWSVVVMVASFALLFCVTAITVSVGLLRSMFRGPAERVEVGEKKLCSQCGHTPCFCDDVVPGCHRCGGKVVDPVVSGHMVFCSKDCDEDIPF